MFAVSRIRLNFWVWVFCRSSSCEVFFYFFVCRSFIEGIEFGVAKVFATRQPASALATILLFASQPNRKKTATIAQIQKFFLFSVGATFPSSAFWWMAPSLWPQGQFVTPSHSGNQVRPGASVRVCICVLVCAETLPLATSRVHRSAGNLFIPQLGKEWE